MDKWEFLIWRAILSGLVEVRHDSAHVTFVTKDSSFANFSRDDEHFGKAADFLQKLGVNLPGLQLPWNEPKKGSQHGSI